MQTVRQNSIKADPAHTTKPKNGKANYREPRNSVVKGFNGKSTSTVTAEKS